MCVYRSLTIVIFVTVCSFPAAAQRGAPAADPVTPLVARLDLERYKDTIKGLTAFGDRREGTDRNRAALDWIEARLTTYGCANIERLTYQFTPKPPTPRAADAPPPLATGVV